MAPFEKYKDLFGKPGEGAHKYKLGGIAIVDTALVLILVVLITWLYGYKYGIGATVGLFSLGIVAHRLFGVRTTVDKWIFSA